MSKNELLSDKANSGAAASRLKCAKKVLDIHRHFIDDFIAPGVVLRIDDPTVPRDGLRPWFGVAGCLIPGLTQRSGDEVSTVTR